MRTVRITGTSLVSNKAVQGHGNGSILKRVQTIKKEKNISLLTIDYIFIDLESNKDKKLVELLETKTSFLKGKKGILVIKNRAGDVTHIRAILFSLFGAIRSFVSRNKDKTPVFYLGFVVLEEKNSFIRKVLDSLRKEFMSKPINGFQTAMLLRCFREKSFDPNFFSFLPISMDPNVRQYFPYTAFGSRPGIYFVKENGVLVYVGKSHTNLSVRCACHFRKKSKGKDGQSHSGVHVFYDRTKEQYEVLLVDVPLRSIKTLGLVSEIESFFISLLNPRDNTNGKTEQLEEPEIKTEPEEDTVVIDDEKFLEDPPF